jgi:hypothetical protein
MPAIVARAAVAAAEMNQRNSVVGMSKDGLSFDGLDSMELVRDDAGKVDHGASAKKDLAAARDFFLEAVTPDKALMLGMVGAVGGDDPDKFSVGGFAMSGALGALGDVLEAIPAAALSAAYLVAAGYNGVLSVTD